MANLNVTYDEMDTQARNLEAAQQEITQRLHLTQQQVSALVSSGFVTDAASGAFEATVQDFIRSANQTIDVLNTLARNLRSMANAYRETDTNIAAQMGH